jgi:hypothetical protein
MRKWDNLWDFKKYKFRSWSSFTAISITSCKWYYVHMLCYMWLFTYHGAKNITKWFFLGTSTENVSLVYWIVWTSLSCAILITTQLIKHNQTGHILLLPADLCTQIIQWQVTFLQGLTGTNITYNTSACTRRSFLLTLAVISAIHHGSPTYSYSIWYDRTISVVLVLQTQLRIRTLNYGSVLGVGFCTI